MTTNRTGISRSIGQAVPVRKRNGKVVHIGVLLTLDFYKEERAKVDEVIAIVKDVVRSHDGDVTAVEVAPHPAYDGTWQIVMTPLDDVPAGGPLYMERLRMLQEDVWKTVETTLAREEGCAHERKTPKRTAIRWRRKFAGYYVSDRGALRLLEDGWCFYPVGFQRWTTRWETLKEAKDAVKKHFKRYQQ